MKYQSMEEELLGSLKLIAGLLAWENGFFWLAWTCFVFAGLDIIEAIFLAIKENIEKRRASTATSMGVK